MDSIEFIAGGRNGVKLNAPKGLAIRATPCGWPTSTPCARSTGRPASPSPSIDLKGGEVPERRRRGPRRHLLHRLRIRGGREGGMAHPGPDQIFKVSGRKATWRSRPAPRRAERDRVGQRGQSVHRRPLRRQDAAGLDAGPDEAHFARRTTKGQIDGIEVLGPEPRAADELDRFDLNVLQNGNAHALRRQACRRRRTSGWIRSAAVSRSRSCWKTASSSARCRRHAMRPTCRSY